jgi:hypothetical protein
VLLFSQLRSMGDHGSSCGKHGPHSDWNATSCAMLFRNGD